MEARQIQPKHVSVIPNGADERRFRVVEPSLSTEALEGLGVPRGARVILTVGSVCERKGQDLVVRAMPAVLKSIPTAHYLAVGLPRLGEKFKSLARSLGVESHVHFAGHQDEDSVVRLMSAADVFVLASRHSADGDFEGFGIAVVEAALCGVPSVVSGGSGLEEAVDASRTGLLVPEEDVDALAAGIIRLLGDEDLRRAMGEAARQRALREQTWDRRVREYDQVLRSYLKIHRESSRRPSADLMRA
jgi:phosphatidylinositol alpha-1,6-mannosyltransferase